MNRNSLAARLPRSGSFWQVLLMPLLVAVIGTALLWLVSFIPRERVFDHVLASAYQVSDDAAWPRDYRTSVGHMPFNRDFTTDSIMIMTSYTLDREHPENVLLKKVNANPNTYGWYRRLVETVELGDTFTESYSRYWMGFRVLMRPLLVFTAYYGIRVIATACLFLLFAAALVTTAKRGSGWTALALALSVGLIEPWAICNTLNFVACILLMLLLILCLNCRDMQLSEGRTFRLFCLFGALTQFFDFYTYPILVCALPLMTLIARWQGEHSLRHVGRLTAGWLLSWLASWLINMTAVTLFTADNGIRDAFRSVSYRFGVGSYRDDATSYSVAEAFRSVRDYLHLPSAKLLLPALALALILLYLCARRAGRGERFLAYLLAGSSGLLWIAATAQPVIIHTYMQYRNVCTVYFALMLCALEALGFLSGEGRLARLLWRAH